MRRRLSTSARWTIVCAVVVVALAVAIRPHGTDVPGPSPVQASATVAAPADLEQARTRAALAPCVAAAPRPAVPADTGPLGALTLTCLSDGRSVDLGSALAGRPALVNIWAYWCGPCRVELPTLAEAAKRADGRLIVLTVHADPNPVAALDLLAQLGVHLPTVEDPQGRVGAAAGAPRVYPTTVLVRADGSVAGVQARPFTSVADVAAVVRSQLGVTL